MAIIKKRKSKFTQVHNVLLSDSRLSLKAIGLFCYMFSKPDNWHFTIKSMSSQLKDGQNSIVTALKELKQFGYVKYNRCGDGTGEYYLDDQPDKENQNLIEPHHENPHVDFPHMDFPHVGNPDELIILYPSNKELSNTKRETRALDFFKKYHPSQWETFLMQHKSKIKNFQKFYLDFNDTFDLESREYDGNTIRLRLNKYARNWIENQNIFKTRNDIQGLTRPDLQRID